MRRALLLSFLLFPLIHSVPFLLGNLRGVDYFDLDTSNGNISLIKTFDPSFTKEIVFHPKLPNVLYTINDLYRVTGFLWNSSIFNSTFTASMTYTTSIWIDPQGEWMYADYCFREGVIDRYALNTTNGGILYYRDTFRSVGGAVCDLTPHPNGKFLFHLNNEDSIHRWTIESDGRLTPNGTLKFPNGTNPKSLLFNPVNSNMAFVLSEHDIAGLKILTLSMGENITVTSTFTVQVIEPKYSSFNGLRVTRDGKFLYTGTSSLHPEEEGMHVFSLGTNGVLTSVQFANISNANLNGVTGFGWDAKEKYLMMMSYGGGYLTVFQRNAIDGTLTRLNVLKTPSNPKVIKVIDPITFPSQNTNTQNSNPTDTSITDTQNSNPTQMESSAVGILYFGVFFIISLLL